MLYYIIFNYFSRRYTWQIHFIYKIYNNINTCNKYLNPKRMQFFFSCQSTFGDGSDSSAMCKFLPIRVWNMEPSSRDPRGSKFDQHVRSVGQSVTSDSETHPGGTTEQRRQQRHLEGEDVLQVLHGHPWVQRKFFSNLHLLEKSYVSS